MKKPDPMDLKYRKKESDFLWYSGGTSIDWRKYNEDLREYEEYLESKKK